MCVSIPSMMLVQFRPEAIDREDKVNIFNFPPQECV